MRLDDKTAVVTGGGSGIGRATCEVLAEVGARVFVGDIDLERAEATAAAIRRMGGEADAIPLDVTDGDSIDTFARVVHGEVGKVDVVVNAAGWDKIEPFVRNTPDYWDRIVALNYMGVVRFTRAFLDPMIEANAGRIVNVASDAGRVGSMGETVYAGAKGGVIAFSKSLAREMARHGITVNCICPGPTNTPLFASQPEKMREALIRAIPLRRLAEPRNVADAILFFSSNRAEFITGQVLSVSGGLTMVG